MKSIKNRFKFILSFTLLFFMFTISATAEGDIAISCPYEVKLPNLTMKMTFNIKKDGSLILPFEHSDTLDDFGAGHITGLYVKNFENDYIKASKLGDAYQCPTISVLNDIPFITMYVGHRDGETEGANFILAELLDPIVNPGGDPNDVPSVKINKTCEYEVFWRENDLKLDIPIKLFMNNYDQRILYIGDNSATQTDITRSFTARYSGAGYTMEPDQANILFKQDNSVKDGKFICPKTFYIIAKSISQGAYIVSSQPSTDSSMPDSECRLRLDDGKKIKDDMEYDEETHEYISCDDFVNSKDGNMIQDIFDLIMLIAPILVIVLGGLDFAKASLQSDENAIKKAGINFGKRLIAAVLLFLLPLIISLIMEIAFDAGVLESIPEICID